MNFATKLKQLRKEHHMTQETLAKLLKVAKSTISMYEQGERMPSFEIMESLANIFNVSIDTLYGRENTTIEKSKETNIGELKVALFGSNEDIPEQMWNDIMTYAQFLKTKYKK